MDREKWKIMTMQSLDRGRTAGNGIYYNLPDMRENETGKEDEDTLGKKRNEPRQTKCGRVKELHKLRRGKGTQYLLYGVFN